MKPKFFSVYFEYKQGYSSIKLTWKHQATARKIILTLCFHKTLRACQTPFPLFWRHPYSKASRPWATHCLWVSWAANSQNLECSSAFAWPSGAWRCQRLQTVSFAGPPQLGSVWGLLWLSPGSAFLRSRVGMISLVLLDETLQSVLSFIVLTRRIWLSYCLPDISPLKTFSSFVIDNFLGLKWGVQSTLKWPRHPIFHQTARVCLCVCNQQAPADTYGV